MPVKWKHPHPVPQVRVSPSRSLVCRPKRRLAGGMVHIVRDNKYCTLTLYCLSDYNTYSQEHNCYGYAVHDIAVSRLFNSPTPSSIIADKFTNASPPRHLRRPGRCWPTGRANHPTLHFLWLLFDLVFCCLWIPAFFSPSPSFRSPPPRRGGGTLSQSQPSLGASTARRRRTGR